MSDLLESIERNFNKLCLEKVSLSDRTLLALWRASKGNKKVTKYSMKELSKHDLIDATGKINNKGKKYINSREISKKINNFSR